MVAHDLARVGARVKWRAVVDDLRHAVLAQVDSGEGPLHVEDIRCGEDARELVKLDLAVAVVVRKVDQPIHHVIGHLQVEHCIQHPEASQMRPLR